MKKAIVLLSGGLDSTTVLAIAKNLGFEIYALAFSYGQRHKVELESAKKISKKFKVKEFKIADIDLRIFGGSALTDDIKVPKYPLPPSRGKSRLRFASAMTEHLKPTSNLRIPVTYVPARNTIFLSFALAYAEVVGAFDIFIGVNAIDYSGYPDCRPKYIQAFAKMANLATVAGIKNPGKFKIHTPLISLSKKEIIKKGIELGVDYSITHSCYDPIFKGKKIYACGQCDSCRLRKEGFRAAGSQDPITYTKN